MQLGDKVLVEGVLSGEPGAHGGWRVTIEGGDAEDPLQGWVNKKVLRPWTEKPPEVAHEVWRKEMNGTTYVVHSDGLVWKHSDAAGEMTSPAESVPTGDEMLEVLAEYVRQNSR